MKTHFIKILHAAYWLGFLLFFCGVYLLPDHAKTEDLPELAAMALVTGGIAFYIANLILFPYLQKGARARLAIAAILTAAISALPAVLYILLMVLFITGIKTEPEVWIKLWAGFSCLALLNIAMGLLLKAFVIWRENKNKTENELQQLKMQLQPHFLFNTLNNIDVLIGSEPESASAYLQKLSGLLRYMLYDTSSMQVALSSEIRFIKNYLDLQALRSTNTEYASFEVEGDDKKQLIPPLLFIPFIENAFKHTRNKKAAGAIHIRLSIQEDYLYFECMNIIGKQEQAQSQTEIRIGEPAERKAGGLGLHLARRRLEMVYKDRFCLTTGKLNDIFKVELKIGKPC